jgi:hypothetical protein
MAENNTPDFVQPTTFAFDADGEAAIPPLLAKYPPGKQASAVIPMLYLVQNQMKRHSGSAWQSCIPERCTGNKSIREDCHRGSTRSQIVRSNPQRGRNTAIGSVELQMRVMKHSRVKN